MVLVAAVGWTTLRSWAQGGRVRSKMENNNQIMLTLVYAINYGVNDNLNAGGSSGLGPRGKGKRKVGNE